MGSEDSIWKIISNGCKKCFEVETSTEVGRINLLGALLCVAFAFFVITQSGVEGVIDKICQFLNKDYDSGMPWYAIVITFALCIVYFIYCVNKVSKINKLVSDIDSQR